MLICCGPKELDALLEILPRCLHLSRSAQSKGMVVQGFGEPSLITQVALDCQCFGVVLAGSRMVDLPPRDPTRAGKRLGAGRGWVRSIRLVQHLVDPASAFGKVPALMPEPPERSRGRLRQPQLATANRPTKRRTQIVEFGVPVIEPLRQIS